jgi:hypothetical protein
MTKKLAEEHKSWSLIVSLNKATYPCAGGEEADIGGRFIKNVTPLNASN